MFKLVNKYVFFIVAISLLEASSFQFSLSEEKATPECQSDGEEFCLSCSVSAACVYIGDQLRLLRTTCGTGTVCDSATSSCSGTDETVPDCGCSSGSDITYQADPYNDHWYIICFAGEETYVDCLELYYDGVQGCGAKPIVQNCTEPGVFSDADSTTCDGYIICSSDDAVPIFGRCPPTESDTNDGYFNPETGLCSTLPPPFQCTVTGAFGDPYDCTKYYVCTGSTLKTEGNCPSGEIYDTTVANCVPDDGSCYPIDCKL